VHSQVGVGPSVLVATDDLGLGAVLEGLLGGPFVVQRAAGFEEAVQLALEGRPFAAVVVDERLQEGRGAELLGVFVKTAPATARLLITDWSDPEKLLSVFHDGRIHGFLDEPFSAARTSLQVQHGVLVGATFAERDVANRRLEQQGRMLEQLVKSRTEELSVRNRQLEDLAVRDPLTGLYNRRWAEERMDAEHARLLRYDTPYCVFIADIDHFKAVNDNYGHAAGDAVLRALAQMLLAKTRKVDSVARYGGEEFLAILPNALLTSAVQAAERLREALAVTEIVLPDGRAVRVTASFGVAQAHSKESLWGTVVGRADHAMYEAKQAGRNRVCHE